MSGRGKFLGFILTAVFLILAARNVDLTAVASELAAADYRYLAPAAAFTLAGYLARTVRWGLILRPIQRISFGTLFSILMLGFATNNIMPARLGELVRSYTLSRKVNVPTSLTLATVVVERVFDGLTLMLFMVIALNVAPVPVEDQSLRVIEVASIILFATALLILVLLLVLEERAIAGVGWLLRPLPQRFSSRLTAMVNSFIQGLHSLRHPRILIQISIVSLIVWLAEASSYALIARAFDLGLSQQDSIGAVLFLLVFVNLGIMIPSAPGYIGTFQFFARLALTAYGVSGARAFGLALLSHAMQYTLVTSIGLVVLWRERLSLTRIVRAPATVDASD